MGDEPEQNGTATKTRKRAPRAKKPVVVTAAPDVLGDSGRARVAAELLLDIQTKMERDEAMQVANDQSDSDIYPDGGGITYAERRANLKDAEKRLAAHYAAVMPAVEQLIEQAKAQAGG